MTKTICKILGFVFLIVGLLGFVAPTILGMHLTLLHNVIHLISGALALYFGFAATDAAAHTFCWVFGIVYLLIGILGFVAPGVVAGLIGHRGMGLTAHDLTPDNAVHIILGVIFIVAAFIRAPRPAVTA